MQSALDLAEQELDEEEGEGELSKQTALLVRDAAMLGMAVGHVGLTVRLSVICSIKAPQYRLTACTRPGCDVPGCNGNRLIVGAFSQAGSDAAGSQAHTAATASDVSGTRDVHTLVVPHHKTNHHGIVMPPIQIESALLNRLVHIWHSEGRALIVKAGSDPQNLFVSNTGRAFAKLSDW
jgi:hypothetical protein